MAWAAFGGMAAALKRQWRGQKARIELGTSFIRIAMGRSMSARRRRGRRYAGYAEDRGGPAPWAQWTGRWHGCAARTPGGWAGNPGRLCRGLAAVRWMNEPASCGKAQCHSVALKHGPANGPRSLHGITKTPPSDLFSCPVLAVITCQCQPYRKQGAMHVVCARCPEWVIHSAFAMGYAIFTALQSIALLQVARPPGVYQWPGLRSAGSVWGVSGVSPPYLSIAGTMSSSHSTWSAYDCRSVDRLFCAPCSHTSLCSSDFT